MVLNFVCKILNIAFSERSKNVAYVKVCFLRAKRFFKFHFLLQQHYKHACVSLVVKELNDTFSLLECVAYSGARKNELVKSFCER